MVLMAMGLAGSNARAQAPPIRAFYVGHSLMSDIPSMGRSIASGDGHDVASPTRHLPWRQRLDADRSMWQRIVQQVNQAHPGQKPVKIIPAGQVLAKVHDAIVAGEIAGWNRIEDLFTDDIQNVWGGDYWDREFWDGNTYPRPRTDVGAKLQSLVAEVVTPGGSLP